MMLLSLHIVAIAALAGICGSIGYQMGVKEGIRVSRLESEMKTSQLNQGSTCPDFDSEIYPIPLFSSSRESMPHGHKVFPPLQHV